jgi:hypothetical protein
MRLPRLRAGTSLRRAGTHLSGARKNGMEKGVLLSKSEFGRFYMSQGLEEVCGNVGGDVEDGTTLVKNLTTSPSAQNL